MRPRPRSARYCSATTCATPAAVEVRIEIRRDPGLALRCLLRAQDVDNVTVGRRELDVPAGADRTVALAVVVPTTRLATNGELEECTTAGRE